MDESTPIEVKYQNKTAILTISPESIKCTVGNAEVFSIDTDSLRTVDIPKKQNILINYQKDDYSIESVSMYSKHVIKIKDSIVAAHNTAVS